MRLARWKVMAGGLLLSAGGLMAVADGPPPVPGCQPAPVCLPAIPVPPVPTITRVSLESPVAIPVPNVAELPVPVPVLPKVEPAPDIRPLKSNGFKFADGTVVAGKAPPPTATNVLVDPKTGHTITRRMRHDQDGKSYEIDEKGQPVRSDNSLLKPADTPPTLPAVPPVVAVPVPTAEPLAPKFDPTPTPKSEPAPFDNTIESFPAAAPAPAVPAARPPATEKPTLEPKKAEPATAEKRLKVVLHMGDDRPRFEVRDGEETYLKVVSDRVEVKSAAGNDVPTMKAGGKVAFVTPGGDGTCDELTILPGSGQVVATGNVAFRHTWGRSETTVTSERMTFRLAHPGPTAIQAGYTPVR